MKTIVIPLLVFLLAFGLSLAGVLAATGNLNKESLGKMFGSQQPAPLSEDVPDETDAFVLQLKENEKRIADEQKQLDEQKKRLRIAQDDVTQMTSQIEKMLQELEQMKGEVDKNRDARIEQAAKTVANMDPKKAAAALKDWPADRAAEVLRTVREKDRAKILDQMDPTLAAQILENIKNPAS